jgi:multiple RNA-binding domain-containing protein 1
LFLLLSLILLSFGVLTFVLQGTKDAPTPRPNKRPRLGPSPTDEPTSSSSHPSTPASKQTKRKRDAKSDKSKGNNIPQLDEYMEVMQPRTKKGPSWANEAHSQPQPDATSSSIGNVHSSRVALIEKAEVDAEEEEKSESMDGKKEEGISDLDWMKRRMKENIEATEKVFEQSDDEMDGGADDHEASREVGIRLRLTLPCQ